MENKFDTVIWSQWGKLLQAKTPPSEFQVTILKESTNQEKAVTSTRILTLQVYPKVSTYCRTYWVIPVSPPIHNWTWSCRRLLLCMNLPIHDWLYNNLFNCCNFIEFFNPRLDESEVAWHKILGAQTSKQLLLYV